MGVNYSDIENQQKANANQQQTDHQAYSNAIKNELINQIANAVDQASAPVKAGAEQQIASLPGQYQKLYDASAIQEAVNRKMLQQSAADSGNPDAALNLTQRAALATQRGNADTDARLQQQKAADNLSGTLQALLADATANKTQQEAAAQYQWQNDNADFQSKLGQMTDQKILNLYASALQQQLFADKLAQQGQQQEAQLQEAARQANAQNKYNYDVLDYQEQKEERELQYQKEQAIKQQQQEKERQKQINDSITQQVNNAVKKYMIKNPVLFGNQIKQLIDANQVTKDQALDAIIHEFEDRENENNLIEKAAEYAGLTDLLSSRVEK